MEPVLETGTLREKHMDGNARKQEYIMTLLNNKHLPQIMALQEIIVKGLSRPDMLESFAYSFMKAHIGHQGFIIGILCGSRLIAFRNVYFPESRDKNWNLGIDVGLAKAECAKVANLQMVCVDPGFRGNLLALKMNRVALDLLRQRSIYEHICATVSPHNFWNIRILLNSGFRIITLKTKYAWKLRYIVYQNLNNPLEFINSSAVHIPLDNLESQKELFNSGYSGVALQQVKSLEGTLRNDLPSCFNIILMKPSKRKMDHPIDSLSHGWPRAAGDYMGSGYLLASGSTGAS